MNNLLHNNCIKYVTLDDEAGGQTGEIGFLNGEIYDGEIHNNRPFGTGRLTLNDKSYYQGHFDSSGLSDGKYVHSSFNSFEGNFLRDRFKKGRIIFTDGDVLEGEWGLDKSRWSIKWCNLIDEDGKVIGRMDRENKKEVISLKSKNKVIYRTYEKYGFTVVFTKSSSLDFEDPEMLGFTADGTVFDEKKPDKTFRETSEQKAGIQLPFSKVEEMVDGEMTKSVIRLCLGITVERRVGEEMGKLSFRELEQITGYGEIEFTKMKFHFKGDLFVKEKKIGAVVIKKSSFSKLVIRFRGFEFSGMMEFLGKVCVVCGEEFGEAVVLPSYPTIRKQSQKSKEAMSEIIEEIKKHNECSIM